MARVRLRKEEFLWREWRLGEGRFRGKGPKSQPRPAELPRRVPMIWYARFVVFLQRRKKVPINPPPPVTQLGVWAKRSAFYRNPRGGNESFMEAAQTGKIGIALFNIGDHAAEEWDGHAERAAQAGIEDGYWMHCRSVADVDRLLAETIRKGKRLVCINVESHLLDTVPPPSIAEAVERSGYTGEWSTILLGWVQNGVDLRPIGRKPVFLEIFPADAPQLWPPREKTLHCLEHARAQNALLPIPCYQTYRGGMPDWYDLTILHSLYTVDDMAEQWDAWTPG